MIFNSSPQVQTNDVDEASAILSRVFLPVDLNPTGPKPMRMHMMAEELPLLTAGYLDFGTDIRIGGDEIPAYYIEAPLSGTALNSWRDGRMEKITVGSAAVFTPGMPVDLGWSSDCREICIKVSQAQMQTQLEAMLDRPVRKRITFARNMNLRSRATAEWFRLVRILAREAGRADGVLAHGLALHNLQQLLVEGLLLLQPHNHADELSETDRYASPSAVKCAVDLMQGHPEMAWDTSRLAFATGLSARALQKAFQRSGLPPPMTYLRRLRLERARADLASAHPGTATVTAVAGRWGFVHLGRFAEQYRHQFGESPSTTLRVSRSGGIPERIGNRGEDLEHLN